MLWQWISVFLLSDSADILGLANPENAKKKKYVCIKKKHFLSFNFLGVAVTDLARWHFFMYLVLLICNPLFFHEF